MSCNLTVVHSNELIEAAYSLSLDEMRLICLASAKIDSRGENIGKLKITVCEFRQAYGIKNKSVYVNLRDAVKALMRKPIKIYQGEKIQEIAWLEMNEYNRGDNGSHVIISFSRLIEPYLFELSERFTSINFEYAARLNTHFSFRLYQWLIKAKNLHKHKLGEAICVELELEWMKSQAGIGDLYSEWMNFNKRLVKPSVDKINANTDISIAPPEPIFTNRKVTALRFVYVLEQAKQIKPMRPRLHRRPHVLKGAHAEAEWMRKNEKLLIEYEKQLKQYDPALKLELADVRRLVDIYKARGETLEIHEHYHRRMAELKKRSSVSKNTS